MDLKLRQLAGRCDRVNETSYSIKLGESPN